MALLEQFIRRCGEFMNAEEARRLQMRGQYLSRINTVIDYIERNLANEFTLDELAAVAGLSLSPAVKPM